MNPNLQEVVVSVKNPRDKIIDSCVATAYEQATWTSSAHLRRALLLGIKGWNQGFYRKYSLCLSLELCKNTVNTVHEKIRYPLKITPNVFFGGN